MFLAEPEYYQVPKDHAAMHRAVIEARKTVGEFITAVNHPAPGQQDFEVKKPFIQGNEVEHIWLSDVRFFGNRFRAAPRKPLHNGPMTSWRLPVCHRGPTRHRRHGWRPVALPKAVSLGR
jgi:hypothetical protein